jgi:hypothetical protein
MEQPVYGRDGRVSLRFRLVALCHTLLLVLLLRTPLDWVSGPGS